MLDGRPLIDAHVHAARLPTLPPAWRQWAGDFGAANGWPDLYDADPDLYPAYQACRDAGVPVVARNARAIASLGLDEETVSLVLGGNALQIYKGLSV